MKGKYETLYENFYWIASLRKYFIVVNFRLGLKRQNRDRLPYSRHLLQTVERIKSRAVAG